VTSNQHQHAYVVSQTIGCNDHYRNNSHSVPITCEMTVYEWSLGLNMIGLYCARHAITMVSKVGLRMTGYLAVVTTSIAAVQLISRASSFDIISSSINVRPTGWVSYMQNCQLRSYGCGRLRCRPASQYKSKAWACKLLADCASATIETLLMTCVKWLGPAARRSALTAG